MRHGALWIGLLLSVGFNLGLLVSVLGQRDGEAEVELAEAEPDGVGVDVGAGDDAASGAGDDGDLDPPAASSGRRGDADDAVPGSRAPSARPPGPAGDRPRAVADSERVADRLRLEGEARERFLELQASLRRRARELGPQAARLRRELVRQLAAERLDVDRIERLIAEGAELRAELDRELARTVVETRELLTPRQEQMFRRYLVRRLREGAGGGGPAAGRAGATSPTERGAQTPRQRANRPGAGQAVDGR